MRIYILYMYMYKPTFTHTQIHISVCIYICILYVQMYIYICVCKKECNSTILVLHVFLPQHPQGLVEMKQHVHVNAVNYWTKCCITDVAISWGE